MITSILYFLFFPFILCFYCGYFLLGICYYIFKTVILIFWEFIKFIGSITPNTSNYNYSSNKKDYKEKNNYKDLKFETEAKLWGLSDDDKMIAKQERLSPAELIEAEERDDDELSTDEWE